MLLILLFCLSIVYGQPVESSYKIGYTTVKNAQYPYSSNITQEFNSGRPSSPRRVKGYVEDGEGGYNYTGDNSSEDQSYWFFGTESWNFWDKEDDYNYYWDGTSWWRKKKGTSSDWEKWTETSHWFQTCYDWISGGSPINPHQGYHENPTPIDDPVSMLYLLSIYVVYERFNKKRKARKLGDNGIIEYDLNV